MPSLDNLLSRIDYETLEKLVGKFALKLLTTLDAKMATPANLQRIAISLHTREGLLLSKEYRSYLIDVLRPEEAKILAALLSLDLTGDVYDRLKAETIKRGSGREKSIFDFFEVPFAETNSPEQLKSLMACYPNYSLFKHQREAVKEVQDKLYLPPHRVLLHMPTGAGKTRTAMNVIAEHLRTHEPTVIVWLAHSEELCEQAASEFEKAWKHLGNREVTVWRFWGDRDLDPSSCKDGIVIAGLSKTYSAVSQHISFIVSLAGQTSLVVIDEAHSAIANTYSLILDSLVVQRRYTALLGLTATPGRTWSDIHIDAKLAGFFNRQKVTLRVEGYENPIEYLVEQEYLAKVTYTPLYYEGGIELSTKDLEAVQQHLDVPEKILRLLAEDDLRNLKIITEIERLVKRHQRIIVFASTVEHAHLMASVLQVRGYRANAITGNTSSVLRAKYIEDFKSSEGDVRILCNFGVLTTGFDAPRTSAALIARPTKSLVLYSQMVGRAIRGIKAGGNQEAEIVTVVDYQLPGFGSVADAFNNWEDVWE